MKALKIRINDVIHEYSACERTEFACRECSLVQQCKRLHGSSLCYAFDEAGGVKPLGIYGNFKIKMQ